MSVLNLVLIVVWPVHIVRNNAVESVLSRFYYFLEWLEHLERVPIFLELLRTLAIWNIYYNDIWTGIGVIFHCNCVITHLRVPSNTFGSTCIFTPIRCTLTPIHKTIINHFQLVNIIKMLSNFTNVSQKLTVLTISMRKCVILNSAVTSWARHILGTRVKLVVNSPEIPSRFVDAHHAGIQRFPNVRRRVCNLSVHVINCYVCIGMTGMAR